MRSARIAASASARVSTATNFPRSAPSSSSTPLVVMTDVSLVKPAGIELWSALFSPSTTRSSDRPPDSALSIPSALTAELRSSTTIESASGPSAAATAASHPAEMEMSEARRPLTRAELRPARIASPPSRCMSDSCSAARREVRPAFSRAAPCSSAWSVEYLSCSSLSAALARS